MKCSGWVCCFCYTDVCYQFLQCTAALLLQECWQFLVVTPQYPVPPKNDPRTPVQLLLLPKVTQGVTTWMTPRKKPWSWMTESYCSSYSPATGVFPSWKAPFSLLIWKTLTETCEWVGLNRIGGRWGGNKKGQK